MEVLNVLHVDGGTHHMRGISPRRLKHMGDVLQRLCRLLASGVPRQLAGGRVKTQLAGCEHEAVGFDGLTVRTQSGRRVF